MIRIFLAAAAAFALVSATPALACPNCHHEKGAAAEGDCPMHKDTVATAGKAEKKEGETKPAACACAAAGKECACGEKCQCPHCSAKHAGKKDAGKKS